jgi:hypothetical protein
MQKRPSDTGNSRLRVGGRDTGGFDPTTGSGPVPAFRRGHGDGGGALTGHFQTE